LPRLLETDRLLWEFDRAGDPLKQTFLQRFPYFDGSNGPLEQQQTSHISYHAIGPEW